MEAQLSLSYDTRLLLSWLGAALLALLLRTFGKQPWHRAWGYAIMTVPLWLTAWSYVNTIQRLADSGSVLPTYSTWILSALWSRSLLVDLGYIGAGFLVWASNGSWNHLWNQGTTGLARAAARAGLPMGRRSEGASIGIAVLAFPVFIAATWLINWAVYSQPALVNGDERSVWDNMTPYHTILISLSAGVGEELVYRGVLMVGLLHLFRRMPGPWPTVLAVTIQALVFGFAHAGYGTWAHVIVPTLFGLFAGVVAVRYGIWSAIVLHVLVDVLAFGVHAADNAAWFGTLLAGALLLNLIGSAVWAGNWAWNRIATRKAA